ncbi:uncharacterized protein LOC130510673 isoform X1 [Raphanus sativus]|uniref:Uncharacterized protein LOC130510673 isoform X1 n=2 Tax=Raphanus sativus TaxID=3726 RepID=A0A9W3DHD1_RAPSA|nr:uncharacterized protein LOC130510673 isoform X1 [Raphanus sativus]XP_056863197.1 uncharacterized protein LOC130510673 isoform X1 [Raphanus sativus]XP_056863198.1 uncharacterized protein LOC130510673 isoform X1 [Raphanus sativus]XP_056863199.1 uncharacterized protein LOC130510673 isoform X1 [Raphanus sativus]
MWRVSQIWLLLSGWSWMLLLAVSLVGEQFDLISICDSNNGCCWYQHSSRDRNGTVSGVAVLLVIIEQVKCLPYNEIVNIPFRDESMRYGQNLEVNGEKGTGQVEEFSKINLLLSI